MREIYLFVKRFLSSPSAIGSLFPSSQKLGLCMAQKPPLARCAPLRYLEVGAGSGALTRSLVKRMQRGDWMDIVENDPKFCISLRRQFAHHSNVAVHEMSILDFEGKNYDILISSLPLNAFRAHMVGDILKKYERLVKREGYLSYYEYLGLEKIKRILLFGKRASDFHEVQVLKGAFENKYRKEEDKIWWNFPPARIIHCKMANNEIPDSNS
jgi:phosphatidylethanolamine/phosphatidyl-N-methylethanolamine N-methyltransferase